MALTADQQSAQNYINNSASGQGGADAYVANQTAKYNLATSMGDTHMLDALAADSQRTGLSYTPTVSQPTTNVAYQPTVPFIQPDGTTGSRPANTPTTQPPIGSVPFIQPDGTTAYRPSTPTPTPTPVGGQGPFTSIIPGYSPPPVVTGPTTQTTTDGTQQDGTLHLNVNGQAGTDVPVFKGSSFDSGSDLAKQLGLEYKADPKTGEITIGGTKVMPTGYDKQGNAIVGVRAVANALGYQIGYDDKSKTITITGKPPTQPAQPWQSPDVTGLGSQMMPYSTFNGDMNSYYTQAHNQLDAQYNQQKQDLLDKQNTDIKASDESMNRRGIYSSGVAQSVEDDLRTKTTAAVANVLAKQMAAVATTAQSLYNTAYKQYLDGNTFALKNNQAVITNMLNAEKQSFNEYIQTHKLSDAETNAANAEYDKQAALIQKDNQSKLPYEFQTANNIADNQTKSDIALLPYQQMTVYQQMTTQEKATMDAAMIAAKQQGLTIDSNKLAESIRHNTATETNTADHNTATETETNRHNTATETAAGNKPLKIDSKGSYNQSESIKSQLNASIAKDSNSINNKKAKDFIDANKDVLTDSDYRDLKAWADSTFKK